MSTLDAHPHPYAESNDTSWPDEVVAAVALGVPLFSVDALRVFYAALYPFAPLPEKDFTDRSTGDIQAIFPLTNAVAARVGRQAQDTFVEAHCLPLLFCCLFLRLFLHTIIFITIYKGLSRPY